MQQYESFSDAFIYNLTKSGRPNSPPFPIKGLESKTPDVNFPLSPVLSFKARMFLSKDKLLSEPTPRKSPSAFYLNPQPNTPQAVIRIQLYNNDTSRHIKSNTSEPALVSEACSKDQTIINDNGNNKSEALVIQKEVSENVKSPNSPPPKNKRQTLLRKIVGLERDKKENKPIKVNRVASPNSYQQIREMSRNLKSAEGNALCNVQKGTKGDHHKENENHHRSVAELEKKANEALRGKEALEREAAELRGRVDRLTRENQEKDERYYALHQMYNNAIVGYKRENDGLTGKLKEIEQRFNDIGLVNDQKKMDCDALEYISEVVGLSADIRQSNSSQLREEIVIDGVGQQGIVMNQESIKQIAETLRQKNQLLVQADVKLKHTLKSTLNDLAFVKEKANQIEVEYSEKVRELEKKLSIANQEKEEAIETKKRYECELELRDKEIVELKRKNRRLLIEKEGLSNALLKVKQDGVYAKCMSVNSLPEEDNYDPNNVDWNESNEEYKDNEKGGRVILHGSNSARVDGSYMAAGKERLEDCVRQLETEVEEYSRNIKKLQNENQSLRNDMQMNGAGPLTPRDYEHSSNGLSGFKNKLNRANSVAKENTYQVSSILISLSYKGKDLKECEENNREDRSIYNQLKVLAPRENLDLNTIKTPPFRESFKFNQEDSQKKGSIYLKSKENTEWLGGANEVNTESKERKSFAGYVGYSSENENLVNGVQKPRQFQHGKSLKDLNLRGDDNKQFGAINF